MLPAALVMLWRVGSPTYGAHAFRQAHVVANVELFVREGLSWTPSTYNEDAPGRVFDWPIYELTAAVLSRLGMRPAAAARALSVISQIALLGLSWVLLKRETPSPIERLAGIAFCAYSPLQMFFGSAPLPDGFALAAAYGSAVCLLDGSSWTRTLIGCALGAGATAIKAPVFLPVLVGLLWESVWLRAPRRLASSFAAAGVAGLALLASRRYAAAVNAGLNTSEAQDYFGDLASRVSWAGGWSAVVSHAVFLAVGSSVAILAVVGLLRCRRSGFLFGLGVGCIVTLLTFFPRFRDHSYYHLPLTLPFAFLATTGLGFLGHLRGASWQFLVPAVLLAHLGLTTVPGFESQTSATSRELLAAAAGRWLQTVTGPTEYVIYAVDSFERDWSPLFLLEAHRWGYNVSLTQVQRGFLTRVRTRTVGRFARCYVFCPAGLPPWVAPRLETFGLTRAATSSTGVLYSFRGDGGKE